MLKSIKTEKQYETALNRIYKLMQKKLSKDSAKADELIALSILVNKYESTHYPVPKPLPAEAIRFRKEQMRLIK